MRSVHAQPCDISSHTTQVRPGHFRHSWCKHESTVTTSSECRYAYFSHQTSIVKRCRLAVVSIHLTCSVFMPGNGLFWLCYLSTLWHNQVIKVTVTFSFTLFPTTFSWCPVYWVACLLAPVQQVYWQDTGPDHPCWLLARVLHYQNHDFTQAFGGKHFWIQQNLKLLSLHNTACCSWTYNLFFTHHLAEAHATCKMYALQHFEHESLWRTDLTMLCLQVQQQVQLHHWALPAPAKRCCFLLAL